MESILFIGVSGLLIFTAMYLNVLDNVDENV